MQLSALTLTIKRCRLTGMITLSVTPDIIISFLKVSLSFLSYSNSLMNNCLSSLLDNISITLSDPIH